MNVSGVFASTVIRFASGCTSFLRAAKTRVNSSALGIGTSQLVPFDPGVAHGVAYAPLPGGQVGGSGLDLDEDDAGDLTFAQAVEDHEIHRGAEEADVLGVEGKVGEVGHELLVHLPCRHGEAPLNRVLPYAARIPRFPQQESED